MVIRIRGGKSLYGALKYNTDKEKNHVGRVLFTNGIEGGDQSGMQEWMLSFEPFLEANKNTKKPIIHISINPHPDDILSHEQYSDIASEYMERMGYGDQPYVVFLHEDIDRKHLHIVSTRVDINGDKLKHSFEGRRSNEIRKDMEQKYSLKPAHFREETTLPLKKMHYGRGHTGAQMGGIVLSASEQYRFSTFGEFNALLSCYNLTAWELRGVAGKEETPYRGLMYSALDENGERVGNPIKSSRLGDYAGMKAIERKMEENREYLKDLPRRKALGDRIRAVVAQCKREGTATKDEIVRRLEEKGISTVFRVNDDGRLTGATFIDHKRKNVYNGSNLGKDLSANEWHKLFTEPQPERETVQEVETREQPQAPRQELPEATTDRRSPETEQDAGQSRDSQQTDEQSRETYHEETYFGGLHIFDNLMTEEQNEEEIDPEFRLQGKKKKVRRIKR